MSWMVSALFPTPPAIIGVGGEGNKIQASVLSFLHLYISSHIYTSTRYHIIIPHYNLWIKHWHLCPNANTSLIIIKVGCETVNHWFVCISDLARLISKQCKAVALTQASQMSTPILSLVKYESLLWFCAPWKQTNKPPGKFLHVSLRDNQTSCKILKILKVCHHNITTTLQDYHSKRRK